jgi:predicted dehydrogenase
MKIAFIGGSGHHYLSRMSSVSQHELASAPDGYDDAASSAFASKLPGAKTFSSVKDLLDVFKPDVVSIGAVYAHQSEFACMCLERDIPAVCDKPVAANWTQLDRLHQLIDGTGRKLITEFDFRAKKEFRSARDAVKSGLLGEIALITGQKSYRWGTRPTWYSTRDHYPSTLMWIGCHAIDAISFVAGRRMKSVTARQRNVTRPEYGSAEDHATATYALDNGGTAVIHADYLRPAKAPTHGDDRLRVAGSKGVLEVRSEKCMLITADEEEKDITDRMQGQEPGIAMLEAAMGKSDEFFSTRASLEMAEILLHSRDAADLGMTVPL